MVKNGGGRVCHSNLRVGMFPRVLWAAVCAFFCIMGLNEIRNAFHDPQYQWLFGSEAVSGLPWYHSRAAYVSCMAGEVLWYLVGMGLSFSAKRPRLFHSIWSSRRFGSSALRNASGNRAIDAFHARTVL